MRERHPRVARTASAAEPLRPVIPYRTHAPRALPVAERPTLPRVASSTGAPGQAPSKPRCLAPGHTKVTYMVNPPRVDAARQYKGGAVALTKGARLYYAYHRDHARRYILCNLLARPLRTHLRFMECGKVATGWWRRGCDSRRCRHGRLLLATHGWTCATFGCYGPVTQGYSRFRREAHE